MNIHKEPSTRAEPRTKMKVEARIDQVMETSYGPIEARKANQLMQKFNLNRCVL